MQTTVYKQASSSFVILQQVLEVQWNYYMYSQEYPQYL